MRIVAVLVLSFNRYPDSPEFSTYWRDPSLTLWIKPIRFSSCLVGRSNFIAISWTIACFTLAAPREKTRSRNSLKRSGFLLIDLLSRWYAFINSWKTTFLNVGPKWSSPFWTASEIAISISPVSSFHKEKLLRIWIISRRTWFSVLFEWSCWDLTRLIEDSEVVRDLKTQIIRFANTGYWLSILSPD